MSRRWTLAVACALAVRITSSFSSPLPGTRWAASGHPDGTRSSRMCDDPSLQDTDPEVWSILEAEARRQRRGLELIASENFASRAVRSALASVAGNKYSEGRPGSRYYGGCEHVDELERLCEARALKLFGLDPQEWGVNVQPYSGSPANLAVYTALLAPGDKLMGLGLAAGGHLTHGHFTAKRRVSAASVFFDPKPYGVDPSTGLIDYDGLEAAAAAFKPKLLVCGASAYVREWDYARMRAIANGVTPNAGGRQGCLLMADMAHVAGLVAGGHAASPFEHCDVVTSTTHKSLRGPRAGVIFYRLRHKQAVDFAVFPSLQGGPHNHAIASLAVALKEASTPAFRAYGGRVVANAKALAASLVGLGCTVATGGTDNHMVLWDVRPLGLTGDLVEALLGAASVTVNKNTLLGDASAVAPGGVRLGTCALTSRGMTEEHFDAIGELLHRAATIAATIASACDASLRASTAPPSKPPASSKAASSKARLAAFEALLGLPRAQGGFKEEVAALRAQVEAMAEALPMPGQPPGGGALPDCS